MNKTWHEQHEEQMSFGDRMATKLADGMGSWRFIIIQTVIVAFWITGNLITLRGLTLPHWDPLPFVLLNLLFSVQAAYTGPILQMTGNNQAKRDRIQAQHDYQVNMDSKKEIEALQKALYSLETDKLDKVMKQVESMHSLLIDSPAQAKE